MWMHLSDSMNVFFVLSFKNSSTLLYFVFVLFSIVIDDMYNVELCVVTWVGIDDVVCSGEGVNCETCGLSWL